MGAWACLLGKAWYDYDMLKIVLLQGGRGPVLSCDVCNEVITDHKSAIAVYPGMVTEGSMASCYHVHKDQCGSVLTARLGKKTSWQDLRRHLQYLCHNLGLSHDDLREDEFDRMMSN